MNTLLHHAWHSSAPTWIYLLNFHFSPQLLLEKYGLDLPWSVSKQSFHWFFKSKEPSKFASSSLYFTSNCCFIHQQIININNIPLMLYNLGSQWQMFLEWRNLKVEIPFSSSPSHSLKISSSSNASSGKGDIHAMFMIKYIHTLLLQGGRGTNTKFLVLIDKVIVNCIWVIYGLWQ